MKRTQIRRRIVAFILMAMMVMEIPLPVYAETENKVLQHIDVEGKTYDYYLDDVGNPYMIIDGEKMYVALPLAHLRVTDPQKIEELNSAVSESTMTRAVPTKYYDISSGGAEVINSPVYSKMLISERRQPILQRCLRLIVNMQQLDSKHLISKGKYFCRKQG